MDADTDGPDLSTRGRERAAALAFWIPETFPAVDVLVAARSSSNSRRPMETLTPLASNLNQRIIPEYANGEYVALAAHLLGSPVYAGRHVIVCWHHATIPSLAAALKVPNPPSHWPGAAFDRAWQIDYADGHATLTNRPQSLLYGDSSR